MEGARTQRPMGVGGFASYFRTLGCWKIDLSVPCYKYLYWLVAINDRHGKCIICLNSTSRGTALGSSIAATVCPRMRLYPVLTTPDANSSAGIDATASVPKDVREVQLCEHHQSNLMPPTPPKE